MFKKIKEFIEAFKNAYNTINVNKFNAKKAIDDYSDAVDDIVYVSESVNIAFRRLDAVYRYFPIKERQDFITKTLDLLRYGRYDSVGDFKDACGLAATYRTYADVAQHNLVKLKKLYKEGKYNEIITKAEEYSEKLEDFYICYGIKENPSGENE
jgi:hypothetical protein